MHIEDRLAISDLVQRYAAYVDGQRLTETAELFAEQAELVTPSPPESFLPVDTHTGRNQIRAALERVRKLDGTIHEIVGHIIDEDPDVPEQATGRTACVAHHFTAGADHQWHLHYDDVYSYGDQGWRFLRRAYSVDSLRISEVGHP